MGAGRAADPRRVESVGRAVLGSSHSIAEERSARIEDMLRAAFRSLPKHDQVGCIMQLCAWLCRVA